MDSPAAGRRQRPVVEKRGGPEAGPISLYVHIPFCETKCPYCDFNTYAKIEPLMPAYVAALRREIGLWGDALGSPQVRTVFFGGGTPSYLPADDLGALLESIRGDFDVGAEAEVTLEANPGDLTHAKLARYLEVGVNRLSIGIQSFDDGLLELLGRRHTSTQAIEAYEGGGAGRLRQHQHRPYVRPAPAGPRSMGRNSGGRRQSRTTARIDVLPHPGGRHADGEVGCDRTAARA